MTEPTERQIKYAIDLGIKIPEGATREDISRLIDMKVKKDKPATDRHKDFARAYGIEPSKHHGKKALFDLIQYELSKPGREKELAEWFIFRVYRSLVSGDPSAGIKTPKAITIQKATEKLYQDEQFIRSVKKYDGRDFVWFGKIVGNDGTVYEGGSDKTIAFKKAVALLSKQTDRKYNDIRKIESFKGKTKPLTNRQKATGTVNLIIVLVSLLFLLKACVF